MLTKLKQPSYELLIEANKQFIENYRLNPLMQLIVDNKNMANSNVRSRLLDCIQIFSNYFQKAVLIRCAVTETPLFSHIVHQHLAEEFGHNIELEKDRKNKALLWDPILDSTSSWFVWKMVVLNDYEKTVLMHLVLEASAELFFLQANKVMKEYNETNYFSIHAACDELHAAMGKDLLGGLTPTIYESLLDIQAKGWSVLNTACHRISELASESILS